ncbi:MAG: hypothetical protein D6748_04490 [Calditrichaeota bacterium]|nr:MAG: hypothetical protein D6748_04490 [Calditrichota bacterium]
MKTIKWILSLLSLFVVLVLIASAILPSHYRLERSVEIEAPDSLIFAQIADFHNWEHWHPWRELYPQLNGRIIGQGQHIGHRWEWDDRRAGKGYLEVQKLTPPSRMEVKLVFKSPRQNQARFVFKIVPSGGGMKTSWVMEGGLSYPLERWLKFFLETTIGSDLEKGLTTLKHLCEAEQQMLD